MTENSFIEKKPKTKRQGFIALVYIMWAKKYIMFKVFE